jgi:putative transposase
MMLPILSVLLAFIAALFRSRTSLCLEHLALRHQLAVYKQTIHRPRLRLSDRLFWVWLSRLWSGWPAALAFVQPRTVIAWQRWRFRDHWRRLSQSGTSGRPAVPREISDLIRDMSRANPLWGSPRIVGELRKLGIHVVKSTVEKYRVRLRKPPSPTWKVFLKNHIQDLVAMDFFVVPTVTYKVLFVLVILAHERRLDMDCPLLRPVQRPEVGWIREVAEVGGLHHHYACRNTGTATPMAVTRSVA